MLPASTAPRPSVRDHGAHFAPDGRQAVTGRVRQTVPHRLADPGSVWDGNETEILSRCTDEIGQVQPTREQIAKYWNEPFERNYRVPGLDNSVMPWKIAKDGSVTNGLA